MDAFETALTRAFAEAPEPEDAGFTVRVSRGVALREQTAKLRRLTQTVGIAAAGAAVVYGGVQMLAGVGPELMASLGLELARAHGAVAQTSMAVLLTEALLVVGAIGGGAAALRQARG
ncbi:MAG TPA: hypothetical protein VG841_09515 [Caulobacterales bacterium]|nr:hypothetical protein [Caulobacterales bacterium]